MHLKNYPEARRLLGLAAAQDHKDAQCYLGTMHCLGEGGPQDYVEARRLYGLAAEQGNAAAQSSLGAMHHHGWGGPQAYAEARRLSGLAALGHVPFFQPLTVVAKDGNAEPSAGTQETSPTTPR